MSRFRLVGRERPLAEIAAALAAAQDSSGGVVLVIGEAGIGKSRLAEEAARLATGWRVLWVPCGSDPRPYGPWRLALHRLGEDEPPDADRQGWFAHVVDTLAMAGADTPQLIVLDDLHEADSASLDLLGFAAPQLRASRVLVVATLRADSVTWADRAAQLGRLVRSGRMIELGALSVDEVAELIASSGSELGSDTLRVVAARTDGNPFLVTELVSFLQVHALGDPVTALAVPDSVRALVAARRAQLPAATAAAVDAAAVLGTRCELGVLADVVGMDYGVLDVLLAPARSHGLLAEGPGRVEFDHDLIRDAVYADLSLDDRRALHALAAGRLARDGAPSLVAQHLRAAGEGGAELASYARLAAAAATGAGAYRDAAGWLAVAGEADPEHAPGDRLAEGEALLAAGDRPGATARLREVSQQAVAAGDWPLAADAVLALAGPAGFEVALLDGEQIVALRLLHHQLNLQYVDTAAPGPLDRRALRARVAARLSVALTEVAAVEERGALAAEALDLARGSDDAEALAEALAACCDAAAGPDHLPERLAWSSEIVALGERLRAVPIELLGRRLRLMTCWESGDPAAASADLRGYLLALGAGRHPLLDWYPALWRGMRALGEGRLADCVEAIAEVRALGAGSANAEQLATTLNWSLLAEVGDKDQLGTLVTSSGLEQLEGIWPQVTRALIALQLGRPDEARARLDGVADQLPGVARDSEWLPVLAQASEATAGLGGHRIADWLYATLLPYAELMVIEGIGAAQRGPVSRHLGLLAAVLGRPEEARAYLGTARLTAERLGLPLLTARICAEAFELLGDVEAQQIAARLYRSFGLLEPNEPGPSRAEFRREGEIWALGFANVEVRLRDAKGLRDIARLLAEPGRSWAAVDLAAPGGPAELGGLDDDLHAPGDLGEVVDATARAAYRRRLVQLADEADEADRVGDAAASAASAAEREQILLQLAAAYGLGGRVRRAGQPGERARTAVTARVRATIRRIERAHPALGRHLRTSIRTGTFCSYEPPEPVRWDVTL